MRLKIYRRLRDPRSRSIFGTLIPEGRQRLLTCEREWKGNRPGESCVPTGFYILTPHDGTKYKNTFGLIGETVSHFQKPGIPRSACVAHWSSTGRGLQGCMAWGLEVIWGPTEAALTGKEAGKALLDQLREDSADYHLLTIVDDFG